MVRYTGQAVFSVIITLWHRSNSWCYQDQPSEAGIGFGHEDWARATAGALLTLVPSGPFSGSRPIHRTRRRHMGTAWHAAGWPDDNCRPPPSRAYRPRHAAPPGFFWALLRPGDPPGAGPSGPPSWPEATAGGPEAGPAPAPGLAPGEPAPRVAEQGALPESGGSPGVPFDWASWTRRRWDLLPRQADGSRRHPTVHQ
jgi:hypothetical protein